MTNIKKLLLLYVFSGLSNFARAFETPLHTAAQNGDLDKVQALLAAGADVNAPNNDGFRPLHFTALENSLDVGRYRVDPAVLVAILTGNFGL